jgi:hypothetical protein
MEAVLTAPILGFLKFTFFILYLQLFRPMRWLRISIYIGAIFDVLTYGCFTILLFVAATPSNGQTWTAHLVSPEGRTLPGIASVTSACLGLVIDIYLLILPLIAISQLQMPTKRKIAVGLTFLTGILACVASLVGIYYRAVAYVGSLGSISNRLLNNQAGDATWLAQDALLLT